MLRYDPEIAPFLAFPSEPSSGDLSQHRGFKLVPEALDALHEWLMTFLTNAQPADSMIEDYRRLAMEDGARAA